MGRTVVSDRPDRGTFARIVGGSQPISVYLDNDVWDFLFYRQLDLAVMQIASWKGNYRPPMP